MKIYTDYSKKKMVHKIKTKEFLILIISLCFIFPFFLNSSYNTENLVQKEDNLEQKRSPSSANSPPDITNTTELEIFMDQIILDQLQSHNIAGATLSIVKNDTILLLKGYGHAKIATNTVVNPETTLFKVASISKTFVATSVMILVENGLLDLNTNVNDYLTAFKVPDTFSEPITLAHLLTHTAGFEENYAPTSIFTYNNVPSLEEILIEELPNRIWPVGSASAYSNWGFALAGYIVEIVSGMPFYEFVRDFILQPLGMEHSSFQQPLPYSLEYFHSYGYTYSETEGFQSGLQEMETIPPPGGLSSTANDMAKFMLMLLQGGTLNGSQIIKNETLQEMLVPYFRSHQQMPGICTGFYEMIINNQTIKTHEGDLIYFTSQMTLIPEEQIGIFISYNTRVFTEPRKELLEEFMDHYYPIPQNPITPVQNFQERAGKFAGEYLKTRINFATVEKFQLISALPYAVLKVTPNYNGTLQIDGKTYVEVTPLLFREVNGDSTHTYAFVEDENGRITHMYESDFCVTSWKRLVWYDKPSFFEPALSISIIFMIVSLVSSIIYCVIKFVKKLNQPSWLVILFPVIIFLMTALFILPFILMPSIVNARYAIYDPIEGIIDYLTLQNRYYNEIKTLLLLPIFFVISTCIMSILTVFAWKNIGRNEGGKKFVRFEYFHFSLLTLLGWFLVWFLNNWNAIGFKL